MLACSSAQGLSNQPHARLDVCLWQEVVCGAVVLRDGWRVGQGRARLVGRGHPRQRRRHGVGATGAWGETHKVRLLGIDAPEVCQSWGPQSREALHGLLQGQTVEVQGHHHDSYGRLLAQLSRQGHDVGAWMVAHGHACSYSYRQQAGPYDALQAQAQSQRKGLFADARAMPPRWFRKRHGSCA